MQYILLGICGSIGATLRYIISILFSSGEMISFPYATLIVNCLGCFILGLLSSGLESKLHSKYLPAIKTGLIGSFTTFSTFSIEVVQLLQHHYYLYAFSYILISVFFGLGSAVFGIKLGARYGEREKLA